VNVAGRIDAGRAVADAFESEPLVFAFWHLHPMNPGGTHGALNHV
jgi:hypothetical protein